MFQEEVSLDLNVEVLPLGVKSAWNVGGYIFRKWEELIPTNFNEEKLKEVSELYWRKKAYKPGPQQKFIDFRELEHVYEMFQLFFELYGAAINAEMESNLPALMETLRFYVD